MPLYENRKISVSFVSEPAASTGTYNDPSQGQFDPALKSLQQKILRIQVLQIVLGLTLVVLSTVAIIEQRIFFGLGFTLLSAILVIFASVLGIHQFESRKVALCTVLALISLLPSLVFVSISLYKNNFFPEEPNPNLTHSNHLDTISLPFSASFSQDSEDSAAGNHEQLVVGVGVDDEALLPIDGLFSSVTSSATSSENEIQSLVKSSRDLNHGKNSSSTVWIVGWLQIVHLVPLGISLLYSLRLYKTLKIFYYSSTYPPAAGQ